MIISRLWWWLRLAFIGLSAFAIIGRLAVSVIEGNPIYVLTYFTILANVFVLLWWLRGLKKPSLQTKAHPWGSFVHGAIVVYIAATGLVFNTLLFDGYTLELTSIFSLINHVLVPIFFVIDWILTSARKPIGFGSTFLWLIFPIAYSIFGFIEGSITGKYRYPFLNIEAPIEKFLPMYIALVLGFFVIGVAVWLIQRPKRSEKA